MPQDWSSLAYSLLPGAVGLLTGGPVAGLAGIAGGVGDIEERRLAVEKMNRDITFKNEEQRRLAASQVAEQKHWENIDQDAGQLAKYRESQMQVLQRQLQEAQKSDEAWKTFVDDTLSEDPELQAAARAYGPAGREKFLDPYLKGKLEPVDRDGASTLLQRHLQMKKEDADHFVSGMTAEEVRKIPHEIFTSRLTRQPYHIVDWESGALIERYPDGRIVRTPGVVTPRPKTATDLTPNQLRMVEKTMRDRWERRQGSGLFAATPQEVTEQWERYRQSAEGQAEFDRETGSVAKGRVEAPTVPPMSVDDEAIALMKQSYIEANKTSGFAATDETFAKWAKTDLGRKRLEGYREYVRRGRAGGGGAAAPTYPVERQPSGTKARRSLDDIAKEAFGSPLGG